MVRSLNSRDSPATGRVTTRVKVSVTSGVSASLLGWREDVMDLGFGKMKRVKAMTFSNSEKKKKEMLYFSLAEERESNFSRKRLQKSYL